MSDWIRESNLIEGVIDPAEDARSHRAWTWLIRQSYPVVEFRHTVLLELHRKLLRVLNPRIAGKYRRCRIFVGTHEGVHWPMIRRALDDWFVVHGRATLPLEIQAAHVAYEAIHPFEDGNGRTGRMLMNWQRVKAGLDPLVILAAECHAYYEWFH